MSADPDSHLAVARQLYAALTLAYPRRFREAYGPLMVQFFADQYRAASAAPGRGALARFWRHTLADLAASVVREHIAEFGRVTMQRESAGSIALGVLLFVLLGAAITLLNFPAPVGVSPLFIYVGLVLWLGAYFVVLGLVLKGWLAGFPRWVYPYLGYALIFPLYISFVATPGLEFFGIPVWGREPWGGRACVPLALVILLALRFSRPPWWGNLARLVTNAWNDWTLLVFGLFGLLPLVVFISLDEVEHAFALWPQLAAIGLICLGAFLYMRLTHLGLRYLALLACAYLAIAILSGSTGYYWTTHDVNLTTGEIFPVTTPVNWGNVLFKAFTEAGFGILFLLVLLPLPLAVLRRVIDWSHARTTSLS